VRKNGTYNPPINRTSVGDEYGAGNPEVRAIPFEAFFAGAANVIFRHASTGVWVKEVREYVREYASTREKLVDPVWFDNQGWEQ